MTDPKAYAARRVVFNALPLEAGGGGVATYIRELLRAMPSAWGETATPALAAAVGAGHEHELPHGVRALTCPPTGGWRRALRSMRGFGRSDLVHALDTDLPLRPGCPSVATVHDLAVFDVPWAFPRSKATAERRLVTWSLRRADAVVAVSHFTAERLQLRLGIDATVIHEAPPSGLRPPTDSEVSAVREKYELPETFALHVGNLEPRKDLATVIAATRRARLPLVLTGSRLWATSVDLTDTRWLGRVPDSLLPGLYGAATVTVCASVYEGFGLPPLEAMACGSPVVSTPVPSVSEIAGAGVGVEVFAPGDVEGLASLLAELAADPERRRELADEGHRRSTTTSWGRAAAETVAVYRRLGL